MDATWDLTVSSLTKRRFAIWRFDSRGEQAQDVLFARRELRQLHARAGRLARLELAEEARCEARREDVLALRDPPQRRDELRRRRVLEEIARGAGAHRVEEQLGVGEGGQHDDAQLRQRRAEGARGVDAAPDRQLDVHQDEVGPESRERVRVDVAGVPVARHPEVRLRVQTLDQPVTEDRMVLHDDDPGASVGHARALSGPGPVAVNVAVGERAGAARKPPGRGISGDVRGRAC